MVRDCNIDLLSCELYFMIYRSRHTPYILKQLSMPNAQCPISNQAS